ncbi:MAG TPA: hypothetical protein VHK88_19940 [Aquihabitans sp.]|jgi:Zn-dependent protease with chaperone function|nr:hypothetical protein [Aquihabitans sp.]
METTSTDTAAQNRALGPAFILAGLIGLVAALILWWVWDAFADGYLAALMAAPSIAMVAFGALLIWSGKGKTAD